MTVYSSSGGVELDDPSGDDVGDPQPVVEPGRSLRQDEPVGEDEHVVSHGVRVAGGRMVISLTLNQGSATSLS